MALTTPEWLTRRGGELRPGVGGQSWVVLFDGAPQYRVEPVPVQGKHGCKITQTINGKLIESKGVAGSIDDAVRGGLEDLRQTLGW